MICRQCGAEIADKALICYRCGTATTEAKYKPVDLKASRRTSSLTALIVFLVLALAGAYLATTSTNDTTRIVGAAVALVAVLLGARRVLAGRR
jgi:ribosomal protein L40E